VKIAHQFSQDSNDLPVGGAQNVYVSWDSTGFEDGTYRIIGYALYDSKATSPQAVLVTTERRIYMPLIQK